MRVIQPNLNHCQAAQDLLAQKVYEEEIDVAIVCEQYRSLHHGVWKTGIGGKAAVWTCGSRALQQAMKHREHDFVRGYDKLRFCEKCWNVGKDSDYILFNCPRFTEQGEKRTSFNVRRWIEDSKANPRNTRVGGNMK